MLPLHFLVPVDREYRWSDLLAVLMEADPVQTTECLKLGELSGPLQVRREAPAGEAGKVDLLVHVGGELRAVVEVKVLSGLGVNQLRRYHEAFPGATRHIVIFPQRLVVDITTASQWRGLTWERVLGAFAASKRPWVAETARAWLDHLAREVPPVDGHTVWNDVADARDPSVALRVRMSWVFGQLTPPEPIIHDLVTSSAGRSAVVRMYLPAAKPDYKLIAEVEERLAVRNYPKTASEFSRAILGPSVKVGLLQQNVRTSAGFDWDYLLKLWRTMEGTRRDWVTTPAKPKADHDRANWQAMIAEGGPPHLGVGFGHAQARRKSECMFGARFQLPPDVRLQTVAETMTQTAYLISQLSHTPPGGTP